MAATTRKGPALTGFRHATPRSRPHGAVDHPSHAYSAHRRTDGSLLAEGGLLAAVAVGAPVGTVTARACLVGRAAPLGRAALLALAARHELARRARWPCP
eukprot:scaffold13730_cov63-Phaeocystis_antarctica.AAC.2